GGTWKVIYDYGGWISAKYFVLTSKLDRASLTRDMKGGNFGDIGESLLSRV
nr:hypothetical protein [Tanacetum cinerariifolium]